MSEKKKIQIVRDSWLSKVMGRDAVSINFFDTEPKTLKKLSLEVSRQKHAFFYVKIPTGRIDLVRHLKQNGFYVVDVNLIFDWAPPLINSRIQTPLVVREAKNSDRAHVLAIASKSFLYSRFHLDPQIPKTLANKIKKSWVDNYFSGERGERMFVALLGSRVVGFLTVLQSKNDNRNTRLIDLVAVDKNYWTKGCGERLVKHFITEGIKNKWRMRVGTQAANIPSIRLYEKCGFRLRESNYVLHAHTSTTKRTS